MVRMRGHENRGSVLEARKEKIDFSDPNAKIEDYMVVEDEDRRLDMAQSDAFWICYWFGCIGLGFAPKMADPLATGRVKLCCFEQHQMCKHPCGELGCCFHKQLCMCLGKDWCIDSETCKCCCLMTICTCDLTNCKNHDGCCTADGKILWVVCQTCGCPPCQKGMPVCLCCKRMPDTEDEAPAQQTMADEKTPLSGAV